MWNASALESLNPGEDEELERRRRALMDQQQSTTPVETPASSTNSIVPTLSPAQQQYKEALGTLPQQADYKPSKWRRFGAALAGGLAGIRDPRMGVEIAEGIVSDPYRSAMGSWERAVGVKGKQAGIEAEAITQDINRRKAMADETTAQARVRQAAETERANRARLIAETGWRAAEDATKRAGYGSQEKIAGMNITGRQQVADTMANASMYGTDWNYLGRIGAANIGAGSAANVANIHGATDRDVARIRAQSDMDVASLKGRLERQGTPATPEQQDEAEGLAVEEVMKTHPEWQQFYTPREQGKSHAKAKSMYDLGLTLSADLPSSLQREQYNKFLEQVRAAKSNILGSKNPLAPTDMGGWTGGLKKK